MTEALEQLSRAFGASHVLVATVRAAGPSAALAATIPFTKGTVDVDGSRAIRRTLDLTIPDPRWLPTDAADALSPYSGRLQVRQGVEFPDGSTELLPVGVFRVESVEGDERRGPIEVIGHSLESVVIDDRFESPRQASGPSCIAMIQTLITESNPSAEFWVDPALVDLAVPSTTWDEDRWGAVEEMATAMGGEVYCDPAGVYRIAKVVDPATAVPAFDLLSGPGGTLKRVQRGYTRQGVFNCVVARSSAVTSDVPVQGVWRDTDPLSPTRWGGPFGKVTRYYSSPLLDTQAKCEAAARTIGLKSLGLTRAIQIEAVPRPDVDAGQAFRVITDAVGDPDGEVHVLDSFPLRLAAGTGSRFVIRTRTTTYRPV